ncbi:MAG TPA: hypothetical protein VGI26_08000 [Solirubrobacteraceae bacterium]|jgi:hypothetical protein
MSTNNGDTPAMRVMEEAIELAIEERSPYPECAAFLNEGAPGNEKSIERAFDERRAVVLVSADHSTRVLLPEPVNS